ncbi:S4 domain-containing protein YaaA [Convivina intestini]|uniref:S4 domain-containing protein YaaA n=1 Tax=Convivina intestini TaxID=1505726 RepID=UPI00200CD200|nr:S4 domain-containing protein YaaA [Convivina intestini]CAH1856906.1 hypothetical protein R078131_01501 [Convivina intestini]
MAITIPITGEYITLAQLLKSENIIESGGQAKYYLADHAVELNGVSEQRRGKKLHPGDQVTIGADVYQIEAGHFSKEQLQEKAEQQAILRKYQPSSRNNKQPKGPASWS